MALRDQLTNEGLKGLFKSNFDLAVYAIKLGKYYLKSGHEASADSILEQIRKNPRQYEIGELEELEEAEDQRRAELESHQKRK